MVTGEAQERKTIKLCRETQKERMIDENPNKQSYFRFNNFSQQPYNCILMLSPRNIKGILSLQIVSL